MESGKILQSDYLDLVFDNRNKKYGGYELRKHYNRRALKALSITCVVILLGIGTPFVVSKLNAKEPVATNGEKEILYKITELPIAVPEAPEKPKEPVDKPAARPKTAATAQFADPKIVKDNNVEAPPPDIKELEHKLAGPVDNPGEEGEAIAMSKEKSKGPFGNGDVLDEGSTGGHPVKDEPFVTVEEMPEFPGGMKALIAFLQNNLRYPAAAKEDGIEGRVYVSFIVNIQGEIEAATVKRGIGGGCDKEALRVVNAMPKWKPGRQNGHKVKVYYTLPIVFKLER